jgi:hypothetical protein
MAVPEERVCAYLAHYLNPEFTGGAFGQQPDGVEWAGMRAPMSF